MCCSRFTESDLFKIVYLYKFFSYSSSRRKHSSIVKISVCFSLTCDNICCFKCDNANSSYFLLIYFSVFVIEKLFLLYGKVFVYCIGVSSVLVIGVWDSTIIEIFNSSLLKQLSNILLSCSDVLMFAIIIVDNEISTSNKSDMAAKLWKFKKYLGIIILQNNFLLYYR